MTTPLAIIIPTHNRCAITRDGLTCLSRQADPDFEIVVVDDGSTDGTREMIRSDFPRITLLLGDGNLWWSAATNLGIRHALEGGAAAVMTLNDDTLPRPSFVGNMKQAAREAPGALIGALAVDPISGTPVYWGERVFWPAASHRPLSRPAPSELRGLHPVTHFPGRGLLIPAAVFARIGLFDARRFPHYAADYDFTLRAGKAGFPVLCAYGAPLGVRVEESGGGTLIQHRSAANYLRHLTGMKGVGNLRIFFRYAIRNCPLAWLPFCLASGFTRRLLGYPAHWLRESLAARKGKPGEHTRL